jgi:hypothetical protein
MYRQLNWVNHSNVDGCDSPTIHCDVYRLRGVTPCILTDIYCHWGRPLIGWKNGHGTVFCSDYSTKIHGVMFE